MPITTVHKDTDTLQMTIVADFTVPVQRLWDAYADARQIEKFWGPVTWPATFTRHDMAPGGFSHYYMTGPNGERSGGYWEFLAVDPGRSFEVLDGFTGPDGNPDRGMPAMRMVYEFTETDTGSRCTTTTYFNSAGDLERMLTMGMEEGMRSAMSQIDDVVADLASFAADLPVQAQILSDTQVRFSRIIRGTPQQVWDAHQDPELLKRWLLGPDGWSMTSCEVATEVGQTYRYAWAPDDGSSPGFALTGELLEVEEPHRAVQTEAMEGMEGPPTLNEQTLIPVTGGTLITLLITYDNAELRDTILATGMTDGMEMSYARLERAVLAAA
ncbi:SRPBCC family protein [Pseudactinotalea sp. Z1739]|uniref:SRPBCC family protein n=1 Tax=Pseudactinotalea sp. Z1739 TaxID=3413028 RepID=UPI003C7D7596